MGESTTTPYLKKRNSTASTGSTDSEPEIKAKPFNWDRFLRYLSLVLLILQYTSHVLVTRYATRRDQTQFLKTVAVFYNEVMKLIAAFCLYFITAPSIKEGLKGLKHHFFTNYLDTLKVSVPAFIYTVQNFLLYVGIENLDAGTHMVTYQLKILTTAFFTVLMLKRRLSVVQWIALIVLTFGVALVQISATKSAPAHPTALSLNGTDDMESLLNATLEFNGNETFNLNMTQKTLVANGAVVQRPWLGLVAVLSACILSGFAGIYFEKILKASDVSLWMRNIQLATLALPIAGIMMAVSDHKRIADEGFMVGFDMVVWSAIALQALGGLVVAVVIKYADNILKAFASSLAIICSSIASIFLFNVMPTWLFIMGAFLVIAALVLYSLFPYRRPSPPPQDKDKLRPNDLIQLDFEATTQKPNNPSIV